MYGRHQSAMELEIYFVYYSAQYTLRDESGLGLPKVGRFLTYYNTAGRRSRREGSANTRDRSETEFMSTRFSVRMRIGLRSVEGSERIGRVHGTVTQTGMTKRFSDTLHGQERQTYARPYVVVVLHAHDDNGNGQ